MRPTKSHVQDGRVFEVCHQRIGRACQIWVFEGQQALGVHSTVSLYEAAAAMSQGKDLIAEAMDAAVRDIECGRFQTTPREAVPAK